MSYIPKVPGIEAVDMNNRNKGDRGFMHHATARLLCPRNFRDNFDRDHEK